MTKFILHGGATSNPSIYNKNFFKEMTKSFLVPVRILLIYFARPKREWAWLLRDDKRKFANAAPKKNLNFFLASGNLQTLIKQIQKANVIYMRGGDNLLLQRKLKKLKNLRELLENKIVAGSSAGANLIAKYYYSTDKHRIERGFGLLPVKVFCHFDNKKAKEFKALKRYKERLTIYILPEARFKILKI